ncbi:globin [Arsenicicoccus dermatophilus]|uniref:globin n=1 Tax=Arsenicicoccus dermatophilus TaxID=1076331 RepID=UPI0039173C2E
MTPADAPQPTPPQPEAVQPHRLPQPGPRRGDATTFYDAMGGAAAFEQLTREFYLRVAQDPELRAMYPEEDLAPAERRLRMFLEQYWGGPTTYSQERGHPRLRMRHVDFAVTPRMRDHWLQHMMAAADTLHLDPPLDEALRHYLTNAANFLVNSPDD